MKYQTISQTQIEEKWYLVDAAGKRIGVLATKLAELLLGKNNPKVRPNLLPRINVVVINSDSIDYTPKRGFTKFYKKFSGFPSGLKHEDLDTVMLKDSTNVIYSAVKGMLPKNSRGRKIISNLKVYKTSEHPHNAQAPQLLDLNKYRL